MSNFSIILLKEGNNGVKQYHYGTKLLFFIFFLFVLGLLTIGWKFVEQFQMIKAQGQLLEKQEKTQMAFQQRIDLYDGREDRITFLEDYVEELKQSEYNSKVMFKKHSALFRSNTQKLNEIHNFICQTMESECASNLNNVSRPHQTVKWLENIHQDFLNFQQSLQKFDTQRKSVEEQANIIEKLKAQLFETEQNLSEHMEFLKVNKETVSRLTKKISKTTGIKLSKRTKNKIKKSKTGRGGPTILDSLSLDSPQALLSSGKLRQFLYQNSKSFDNNVAELEEFSRLIEKNKRFWRHTPTMIPVRSRALSDGYGMRTDPFTGKREYHAGIDFRARRGSKIFAPADGLVRISSRKSGFGLLVVLEHGRGFYPGRRKPVRYMTRFAHLSKILVKRGQHLKRGDLLGLVGSTGRSTGPHLHYEIIVNGRRKNPLIPISRFNPDQRLYRR